MNIDARRLPRRGFLAGDRRAVAADSPLGFHIPVRRRPRRRRDTPEVNAWVVIKPDDTVVVRIARSEMGQGTLTGLAPARRRGARLRLAQGHAPNIRRPARTSRRKRVWGDFQTGGSRGIRDSQDYVRKGGAAARVMLLQAAADDWKVPADRAADVTKGVITHAASSRTTTYGKVALARREDRAARRTCKLKDPKDWTIAGKPLPRLDTADKLNGARSIRHRREAARHAERRDQGTARCSAAR